MNQIIDNVAGTCYDAPIKTSLLKNLFKVVKCMIYSFFNLIRNNAVPRGCWDFCRGRTPSVEVAAATGLINGVIDDCMPHMTTIGKCFQEGQYTLPGPPTNLQV